MVSIWFVGADAADVQARMAFTHLHLLVGARRLSVRCSLQVILGHMSVEA
jgi:hypothetical protein